MDAFAAASPSRIAAAIFSVANFMLRYWRLYCQDKTRRLARDSGVSGVVVVVVVPTSRYVESLASYR